MEKCDQRESPVEYITLHAHQRDRIRSTFPTGSCNKALNGIDVARDAADQVARAFLVMERQRQSLDVRVESASQVVRHPLRDACRQILFNVGANRVQCGNGENADARKLQDRHFVAAREVCENVTEPALDRLPLKKAVQHNF